MKIKKILLMVCFLLAQQTTFALHIQMINESDEPVSVRPVLSGVKHEWVLLSGPKYLAQNLRKNHYLYDSSLRQIRELQVFRVNSDCIYTYNLDAYNLKGSGFVNVVVGTDKHFDTVKIQGHTDKKQQKETWVNFDVQKQSDSCQR